MKKPDKGAFPCGNAPNQETYEGALLGWFETGMEGMRWALQEDGREGYEGLHLIEEGDALTIRDQTGCTLWSGVIWCDHATGRISRPTNPAFMQQAALGCWVHWTQQGFQPDEWAAFFIREETDLRGGRLIKPLGSVRNPMVP